MTTPCAIELDVAHDCPVSLIHRWEDEYGVKFILLKAIGPAGGNPLYKVTGDRKALESLVREHFYAESPGDDHTQYLIDNFLKEV